MLAKAACMVVTSFLLVAAGGVPAAPFAYVANGGSDTVSVIDVDTYAVVASIPVGHGAFAIAVNPAGTRVYVGQHWGGSFTVSAVDTLTNAISATVAISSGRTGAAEYTPSPSGGGIAVDPAGTRLFAISEGHNVAVIDPTVHYVMATMYPPPVFFPGGIAVNSAGTRIFLADWMRGTLHVLDAATGNAVAAVDVPMPQGVAVGPDGARAYVADSCCNVWVVDTATYAVVAKIVVEGGPYGVAVDPGGRRIYASVTGRDAVAIIDAATNTVIGSIAVGHAPTGLAAGRSGERLYVANSGSDDVSVIDTSIGAVIATVKTGSVPLAVDEGPIVITPERPSKVVEYYHAGLDHYFVTWLPNEIAALDAAVTIRGWTRTGESFGAYTGARAGAEPVCRYYIPPELGNSHFYGRGVEECIDTGRKFPAMVPEDMRFMYAYLPVAGACPEGTAAVYRVFSNRPDANHRYMTDGSVRDEMVAKGWLAEGDGPDLVVMCAPK